MNFFVRNMINDKNNSANNQIVLDLTNDNGYLEKQYYVSYGVKIIENLVKKDIIRISEHWQYSKTTMKHTAMYLRDFTKYNTYTKKDIIDLINSGKISLIEDIN